MFLIGVVLYLLFSYFQGLNMPLKFHLREPYKPYARMLVENKIKNKKISFNELAVRFDAKSPKFAKVLLLVIIPLSALVLVLLYPGKKKYYFDHLTLAAELNTFYLYFSFFIIPFFINVYLLIAGLFAMKGGFIIGDDITMPVAGLANGVFCTFAFTRFYKETKLKALLKTVIYLVLYILIVFVIYRIILLSVVMFFI